MKKGEMVQGRKKKKTIFFSSVVLTEIQQCRVVKKNLFLA